MVSQIIRRELDAMPTGAGSALARAAGVAPQTVSKWRKGETEPTPSNFAAIEQFLGMEPGTLRAAAGLAAEGPVSIVEQVNRMEADLAELRSLVESLLRDRGTDRARP